MAIKVLDCPCKSEGTDCVKCEIYEKKIIKEIFESVEELSWPKKEDIARHQLMADIKLDLIAAIAHQKELGIGLKPQDSVWCYGVQSGLTQALGIVEGYEVKK